MRQATCNQQSTRYQEAWMSVYLFTARDQQGSRPLDRAGGQMQFTHAATRVIDRWSA